MTFIRRPRRTSPLAARVASIALAGLGALALPRAFAPSARASSPAGVVVRASRVIYRSGPGKPNRFIIHGAFALQHGGKLEPAKSGFMYFYCPEGKEDICRREWSELASSSGSGKCRSFGRQGVAPRVRPAGSKATRPEPYPIHLGVQPVPSSRCASLAATARRAAIARKAGVLGVLRRRNGKYLGSIFGKSGLGKNAKNALGGLIGNKVGRAYGLGGLGLRGRGRGGGGTGRGTIGLGRLGRARGGGYGTGRYGRLGRRRRQRPRVRGGRAAVRGSLDRAIIQRIIRRHINEVRYCYQRRLTAKPKLHGSVRVRFVIGPRGRVLSSAIDARSTLKDKSVRGCIRLAFRRWLFPKPKGGGRVIVTYPFKFKTK